MLFLGVVWRKTRLSIGEAMRGRDESRRAVVEVLGLRQTMQRSEYCTGSFRPKSMLTTFRLLNQHQV